MRTKQKITSFQLKILSVKFTHLITLLSHRELLDWSFESFCSQSVSLFYKLCLLGLLCELKIPGESIKAMKLPLVYLLSPSV